MNLERYEFNERRTLLEYEFVSKGPKGSVSKMVRFTPECALGLTYFNIAFGDWNEKLNQIDDLAITNNRDSKKVLATVAAIILNFTERFHDMSVYAMGSTPARTRLYQMGIVAHYQEIEKLLIIYGYKNNEWQPFKKGVAYEAFAVRRK